VPVRVGSWITLLLLAINRSTKSHETPRKTIEFGGDRVRLPDLQNARLEPDCRLVPGSASVPLSRISIQAHLIQVVCYFDNSLRVLFGSEFEWVLIRKDSNGAVGKFFDFEGRRGQQIFALEIVSVT
jgi:hypothetical protein